MARGKKIKRLKIKKNGSIKIKLIAIPLILVLFAIMTIGIISSYFMRLSLLDEMKKKGLILSKEFINRAEDNSKALEIINKLIDDKILAAAKTVIRDQDQLSNTFLKKIADESGVQQINWFNSDGVIIYSNIDKNVGWTTPQGHSIYYFMSGTNNEFIDKIRKDSESGESYKYGYVKSADGSFVQIGILADEINKLTENFGNQKLVEAMASDDEIEYAVLMDNNLMAIAHSNTSEIGAVFSDEGSKSAAIDGIAYAHEVYYESKDTMVYNVIYPAVINEEHIGAVSIGYSMENIQNVISKNIQSIIISASITFILLGLVLFNTSNYAVKTINKLRDQMALLSSGNFSQNISQDLLSKNDEFGQISQAVNTMQNSIKSIIKTIRDQSNQLASSSKKLHLITQQSATAANEVAKTVEEIARGVSDQAKDTEQGFSSITELRNLIVENKAYIESLNNSTQKVNDLKNEGLEILKDLVQKTYINSRSSLEVQKVILNTNESVNEISSASEMIKSIAAQTNLLALNAAIEAARAGEAGKGFAVVSDEIRKLAEESNKFAEQINIVIKELTDQTSAAVKTMKELEKVVSSQSESVHMTNDKFIGIANALEEMKEIIQRVNDSSDKMANKQQTVIDIIHHLAAISEENAAGTEEVSASMEEQTASIEEINNSNSELAKIAEELNNQIGQFII
ncbi:HAMP domain-containing protein [Defluviitalea raffinosedens]|uniref:HAMP domain-containing protein n=1 Tax=Defluviitalea raffinosedens TaxID=1450156 RepID=A0A7C8HDR5_9FIRM|nr:methyl-accepting chemotaxis protein [Defluviitalea raffinosedens]KAE9632060.1 HAMP domain-containing protein [Defluviitalea raffinosedens]